jgi:hypothetical protein
MLLLLLLLKGQQATLVGCFKAMGQSKVVQQQ